MFDIISQVARIDHELGLKKTKKKFRCHDQDPMVCF